MPPSYKRHSRQKIANALAKYSLFHEIEFANAFMVSESFNKMKHSSAGINGWAACKDDRKDSIDKLEKLVAKLLWNRDLLCNRELLYAEDGQQYARVVKRLGDGRFEVLCFGDGQTRLAHMRGKLSKRVYVNQGDLVLVCLRAFQDTKTDICHKFSSDEKRWLQNVGELPKSEELTGDEAYRAGFFPDDDIFGWEVAE